MSETPFEGVPIVNDKPGSNGSAEHQIETQGNAKQQRRKGASTGKDSDSAKGKELDDSGSGKDDSWWW